MERNSTLFPNDDIGDALWKMLSEGDNLMNVREIEFSVLFNEKNAALKFGQLLLENNQKLSFCPYLEEADFSWEITAYPEMTANHENISSYIDLLTTSSAALNGKFDGWYCLTSAKLPY